MILKGGPVSFQHAGFGVRYALLACRLLAQEDSSETIRQAKKAYLTSKAAHSLLKIHLITRPLSSNSGRLWTRGQSFSERIEV